jgi:hypothetical protein
VRKIPTLFVRDWDGDRRYVLPEVTPECEWVAKGEGVPTRKYDGTCLMLDEGGAWWARREVKPGKAALAGFVALEHDEETGKTVGWEAVGQSAFARWHAEALSAEHANGTGDDLLPGTYELCGPKVNGDPEAFIGHVLVPHAEAAPLDDAPRDFAGLAAWLHAHPWEGIVWHGGPGGAMAKIKRRDFRPPASGLPSR